MLYQDIACLVVQGLNNVCQTTTKENKNPPTKGGGGEQEEEKIDGLHIWRIIKEAKPMGGKKSKLSYVISIRKDLLKLLFCEYLNRQLQIKYYLQINMFRIAEPV